jgi:hypothetical protein
MIDLGLVHLPHDLTIPIRLQLQHTALLLALGGFLTLSSLPCLVVGHELRLVIIDHRV